MTDGTGKAETKRTPDVDEVLRRIGRNLLLFQQIEHLLKHLMSNARFEGTIAQLPPRYSALSSWFLARGYVVALPLRRGYGETGGAWADGRGYDGGTAASRMLLTGIVAVFDLAAMRFITEEERAADPLAFQPVGGGSRSSSGGGKPVFHARP